MSALHQHPQIYEEDLVEMTLRNGKKRVGLVSTVSWEQDYLTDDESYESDDEEDEEEGEGGEDDEGEDGTTDDEDSKHEPTDEDSKEGGEQKGSTNNPEEGQHNTTSSHEKEMACVAFYPSMEEEDVEASRLVVTDRALLFDGIVARADDPLGQTGVVVDVEIKATILFPNGEMLEGVSTKDIRNVHPYMQDVHVVKDGWLGRIVECNIDVWIEFEDGMICRVSDAKASKLPLPTESASTVETHYYPSLILSVPPKTLKTAAWRNNPLKRSSMKKAKRGVIIQVMPTHVEVDWMCSNLDSNVGPPPPMCPAKALTILDVHVAAQWALGDYAVCPAALRKPQEPQAPPTTKLAKLQARANSLNVGVVMDTKTYVTVRWQDGALTQGMRAIDLVPVQHVLHADFWPEDFVIDKERSEGLERVGVVKRVIASARTCEVMWLPKDKDKEKEKEKEKEGTEGGDEKNENEVKEGEIEEVSMYAIESHPDFSYRLGSLVVRLNKEPTTTNTSSPPNNSGEISTITSTISSSSIPSSTTSSTSSSITSSTSSESPPPTLNNKPSSLSEDELEELEDEDKDTENDNDDDDNNNNNFDEHDNENYKNNNNNNNNLQQEVNKKAESWVGQIINICNGIITVHWADGSESNARPEELFKINDEDYDSESDYDDDEYDDDVQDAAQDAEDAQGENAGEPASQPSILEQAASIFNTISRSRWWMSPDEMGSILNFASMLGINANIPNEYPPTTNDNTNENTNSSLPSSSPSSPSSPSPSATPEPSSLPSPSPSLPSPSSTNNTNITTRNTSPNTNTNTNINTNTETSIGLKFAVLSDSSGHHHYSGSDKVQHAKFLKRVQQEWELLRTTLPDGIYVRTFEDRMDLMTVLFIGPSGTPYEEAVFLFDIHLPPTYPNMPPEMFYYCTGEQLNPNLYKNGNVCLSLLGTWSGRSVEMWQPQSSNILQLLVSVQGLILGTPHPYFLEAGYDKQKGTDVGMHNSRIYNETVYLITIQSIISNAKNPPSPFEEVVKWHFKEKGEKILAKCKARASSGASTHNNNSNNTNNNNINNNNSTHENNNNSTNNNNNTTENDKTSMDESIVFLENPSLGFKKSLGLLIPKLEAALQPYL